MSTDRLDDLERRVARLETMLAVDRSPLTEAGERPTVNSQRSTTPDLALLGRTLIAMGGAYLLRAVTDLQVVPRIAGIALGLAYALSWILVADRHAARGNRRAAIADAALGSLIVFPILWESAVRFRVFTPLLAMVLVVAAALALLAVAARHNLQVIAWMASAGVIACATGLAFETRTIAGSLVSVAVIGAITWRLAERHRWRLVAWPTAIETDLLGAIVFVLVLLKIVRDSVPAVIAALLVAFAAYALARANVVQTSAVIVVHLTAAFFLARQMPIAGALLPLLAVALSLAAYARRERLVEALLLMLIGTAFLGAGGVTWGLFAIAAAIVPPLVYHAVAYCVAAAMAAGLLLSSARVFAGLGPGDQPITMARAVTFAAIAVATILVIRAQREMRIARVLLLANAAILAIGVLAYAAALLTGGEAARAAAARTIVVGLTALALAWLARLPHLADLGMLVYPLLIAGGVKMLLEDFRNGRPMTLFVTLAAYGAILVLVARLRRESEPATAPAPS